MPTAVRTTLLIACSFVVALLSVLNAHHPTSPALEQSAPAAVVVTHQAEPTVAPVTVAPAAPLVSSSPTTAPRHHVTRTTSAAPRCEEDEPCWDPATMGNHRGHL